MTTTGEDSHRPATATPEQAAVGFLARQPALVLVCLCLVSLALIGWAALQKPIPVLAGVAIWGVFLLHRRLVGRARGAPRPSPQAAASPKAAWSPAAGTFAGTALIQAEMTMTGSLRGAGLVEVFGRLSGDVQCETIRVHPGGELRGRIVHQRIGVADGAIFEGVAATPDSHVAVQARTPKARPKRARSARRTTPARAKP